jgi:hypothetical protein
MRKAVLAFSLLVGVFVAVGAAPGAGAFPAGTCTGAQACSSVGSGFTVGSGSCNGDGACTYIGNPVGSSSCDGYQACHAASGPIGDYSCSGGDDVCLSNNGAVGSNSCYGFDACEFQSGSVGGSSCTGDEACSSNKGTVAANSCNGSDACENNHGVVGEWSCNGSEACKAGSGAGTCQGNSTYVRECAPNATPTPSPAPNSAGWNNSPVTVTWNWQASPNSAALDLTNCTTSSSTSPGAEGTIVLTATCEDLNGNTGSDYFLVHVDTVAPTITVPSMPVTADTTSPAGANVDYGSLVSISDNRGGSGLSTLRTGCTPVSGSLFAIGTTTVTCNATDLAGNSATQVTFPVTVTSPPLPVAPPVSPPAPVPAPAAVPAPAPESMGYCAVAGNSTPSGTPIPPGTFLDLAGGLPASDPHYTGAVPAFYLQGLGITCDVLPGYTRTAELVGYGGHGDPGSYIYYAKTS